MKITVVGLGYVGLANALLLAPRNTVTGIDVNQSRIDLLESGTSPISDPQIEAALHDTPAHWSTSFDSVTIAELLIICTPTNYDEASHHFDTTSIEDVIETALSLNPAITILIKSTIPIGYVTELRSKFKNQSIAFSPEFLREGKALYDNLYPSRIIVGDKNPWAGDIAELFRAAALNSPEVLLTDPNEAEAIKLFSNTYLAMRVAYFNELDTFCVIHGLDTKSIIDGVGLDPRIGDSYNNPSFGYGGYCLPKDTKQLLASFGDTPNELIGAIISSNETRKDFIAHDIIRRHPKIVGVHRLVMKAGSDNFRMSAVLDIMNILQASGITVTVYEPNITAAELTGFTLVTLDELMEADIIIANRLDDELRPVKDRVYTRDVFSTN